MPAATVLALCLTLGDRPPVRVPADHFTLSWTHSIEKVDWREEFRVTDKGLVLERSLVKGSGVGMEPGPDAKLVDGWWVSRPGSRLQDLTLAASRFTGDHTLCVGDRCAALHDWLGTTDEGPVRMAACPPPS
ncbi:DUF1850 domain-containing protein [Niveispirillum sp. KHB5.9]|uniref:DUF1850 domain-containing protein n=1 Tax=Niveispirillum sp. KHB5.9 TaxID=3400269 RepID=UPI003A87367C